MHHALEARAALIKAGAPRRETPGSGEDGPLSGNANSRHEYAAPALGGGESGRRCAGGWTTRGVADRDGLRTGRRCAAARCGHPDFRGEGAALFRSAHRASAVAGLARSRDADPGRQPRMGRGADHQILARPLDARAAAPVDRAGYRDLRARYRGCANERTSGLPRGGGTFRPPSGRAQRESFWAHQPDDGRACAEANSTGGSR